MSEHLLVSLIVFFILGSAAGMLSGMLGIGGGVVIVPGLAWLFSIYHFPAASIMQMAAATSLGVMVFSMTRALIAHRRYYVEFWSIYRRWLIPIVFGVLAGVVLAHYLHSKMLGIIFGIFVIFVALKMLIPTRSSNERYLPGITGMSITGFVIGAFSGLLGIGGGALTIPFLIHCNVAMRRAVVISIAVGLTVAMVGTILVIIVGWHKAGLPTRTIGYIYWPAWIGVAVGSIIFVPIGTTLSHRLSVGVLRKALAVVLLVVGVSLLIRN